MDRPAPSLSVQPGSDEADNARPAKAGPLPEYERPAFAAQRYDLSVPTLYRMEKKGMIRMVRSGGRTLVDLASVRSHLANLPSRSRG